MTKRSSNVEELVARPFIDHLVINEDFLNNHNLEKVCTILQQQGWLNIFNDYAKINQDPCKEFFNSFILTGTSDDLVGHIKIGGRDLSFTYRKLGLILNIPSTGVCFYAKNNWPSSVN